MNTSEISRQVKLGAFVLGGLFLFVLSVFFIGKESSFFNRTFTVSAVFKNVEGLQQGDNVWLSGVKIGTVANVEIVKEGKVVVSFSLRDKQNKFIRKNATASIGSDGFIGNKIVVVRPGTSQEIIEDNDTINSLSPADTQELINIAKDVGENTRSITAELKALIAKMNKGEGIVGDLLNDGPLARDIKLTVANLKMTGENTRHASSELTALLYNVQHGNGLLATIITDTTFAATFQQAMGNVKLVSQRSAEVASNFQKFSAKLNNSENAVGVLMADTAFAHKLTRTMSNTENATEKLDENMLALRENFLFRGYFKRQAKKEKKEKEAALKTTLQSN